MSHYGGFQAGDFQNDFQTTLIVTDIGPSVITFMPASSNAQCNENSDYYLTIQYYDVFGNAITPVSASWSIMDDTNKVILQAWTSYTPSGISDVIHISEIYNVRGNPANAVEIREVVFKIVSRGGNQRYDNAFYKLIGVDDLNG